MQDWLTAVVLGVVEGVTEFLPVSSTGHLLLAEHLLGARQSDLFNTVIQSGAVVAVVLIFTKRLKQLAFEWRSPESRQYLAKLAVAFALTGAGGLALKALHFTLPEAPGPVAWATLIGGVLFIAIERLTAGWTRADNIRWPAAIAIGLAQLLAAVFPGLSRSGATIMMALVLGVSRPAAVEFSFLLGIPTLVAAGGLQVYMEVREPGPVPVDWGFVALGAVVAAATAFAAVKWLLHFVQRHTFVGFGWYRIVVGAWILLFFS